MSATQTKNTSALLRRNRFKLASLGGEQEGGFEQAFSSLAYAYIQDKAPRLLDFIVGFQLVDRNQDNTKAIGVFGFQYGKQWLYAPVFFLNGDLKGHELLYIKNQDAFVPMKENWVNYLLSKKPHVLGERSPRDTWQLGGLQPNIDRLSQPPQTKSGSDRFAEIVKIGMARGLDVAPWAVDFRSLAAACSIKSARFLYRNLPDRDRAFSMAKVASNPVAAAFAGLSLDLPDFLASNVNIARGALHAYQSLPGIKAAMDRFYGPEIFVEIGTRFKRAALDAQNSLVTSATTVKRASDSLLDDESADPGKVEIIVRDNVSVTENGPQLTDDEKGQLLRDGLLIKDHRRGDQVSVAYNTQVQQTLINPDESGIYEVLEKPAKFSRMLVVVAPYTNAVREKYVTVVRLGEGGKAARNFHKTNIWTKEVESPEKFREWFDGLSDSASLKKDGRYLAVDSQGNGTTPFYVKEVLDSEDGVKRLMVSFDDGMPHSQPKPPGGSRTSRCYGSDEYVSTWNAKMVINNKPGSKLRAVGGELFVPENFKFLTLKKPSGGSGCGCSMCVSSSGDKNSLEPIEPGNISDIQLMFTTKTARLKLYGDPHEVVISSEKQGQARMSWNSALVHMIKHHGFSEKAAREMLKTAQARTQAVYRVKYAYGYPRETTGPGPSAPAMEPPPTGTESTGRGSVNAIYPHEQSIPVEGLQASLTDPSVYDPHNLPDENTMALAQQAGQTGQKEVFDTAMLSGMLKSVRQDSIVDKHLGDLMKALDRLGRLLFLFYWHGEEFEDRYGRQDMPELEDSIRNSFETLGEVTLFLKEKTIESSIGELGDPSIDEAAGN
jgi:hypothetical protein